MAVNYLSDPVYLAAVAAAEPARLGTAGTAQAVFDLYSLLGWAQGNDPAWKNSDGSLTDYARGRLQSGLAAITGTAITGDGGGTAAAPTQADLDLVRSYYHTYLKRGQAGFGPEPSAADILFWAKKLVADRAVDPNGAVTNLQKAFTDSAEYKTIQAGQTPTTHDGPTSGGITSIPIVGPIIGSISDSIGFSPTIVAIGLVAVAAWAFGLFDGGSSSSKRR